MPHDSQPSSLAFPRLSAMMFLQFFVWGSWYVSMTGWMNQQGLAGLTGWAYTVCPIAAVVSPFFVGMIADRFFATQRVLGVLHLAGAVPMLLIPVLLAKPASGDTTAFAHPYVLLLLAHALCYMPTLALSTSISFRHLSSAQGQFPLVRVFGTLGWIAGNIAVSYLPGGDRSAHQFTLTAGAGALLGLLCFFLPRTPPAAAGKAISVGQVLGLDSLRLLAKPGYAVFALCSFLLCIPLAGYYAFARSYAEHTGFEKPTFTMSYGQMSEIIFMVLMPLFFARLGVRWMLAVGMLAWVVRYALFGGAADGQIMWMVLAGILLHGICYDFFFVTGFIYVDKVAPEHIRAQAQGFLVLLTQGLGLGVGAWAFAKLVDVTKNPETGALAWPTVWFSAAGFAAVVLVLFLAAFREPRETTPNQTPHETPAQA
ncbi:MAG: MFS transporter [Phycisphaeraceae bacterium]|nr:MFS transporter [Phycisphaeraceae bacterium]